MMTWKRLIFQTAVWFLGKVMRLGNRCLAEQLRFELNWMHFESKKGLEKTVENEKKSFKVLNTILCLKYYGLYGK